VAFAEQDLFGLLPEFDFGSETEAGESPDPAVGMPTLELELTR
jgi:hypothetical protein